MKIDSYKFGEMIVEGNSFTNDLIVFPDRVYSNWWRKKGHFLQLEDLKMVFEYEPEILLIGTGAYGVMKVSKEIIQELEKRNIDYKIKKTGKAVKIHNELIENKKLVSAFHLTC